MRAALLSLAFPVLLTLGTPAFAAGGDSEQRSRALYRQAESLANDGNWKDACPLFQAAHDLHGTGGTALRSADCYEKVAQYDRALGMYQYIVDHRDADKNPERVALAERRVDALKKQLGPTPPPPPPAGGIGRVEPPPPPPPPPPPVVLKPNRAPAYAMFGVAGAGVLVGGIAGGLALAEAAHVKSVCPVNAPCPADPGAKGNAETKAWISNAGFGVAIVGAVVGVVLYATGTPKVEAVSSALGRDGLTLRF